VLVGAQLEDSYFPGVAGAAPVKGPSRPPRTPFAGSVA
jgi:hypothetical protein